MQIKKDSLIKYGTLFLLVIFFVEFFWVFLYSPAQETEQATPYPEVQAFLGRAVANATIVGFGLKLFAQCAPGKDVVNATNNVSGVAGVLVLQRNLYLIDITFGRDQVETAEDVRKVMEDSCIGNFTLYRNANLKFSGPVLFSSEDGSKTMEISSRDLENTVGYVDPRLLPGAFVQVLLEADFLADGTVTTPSVVQVPSEEKEERETNSTVSTPSPQAANASNSS
ncbi:MAG: hypothetical protein V1811_03365 [Candidatus Micrarchaeota archaeon]